MPDEPRAEGQAVSPKGAVIALAVLAAVLLAAVFGYRALVGEGSAADIEGSTGSAPAADAVLLADYDCEVQTAEGAPMRLTQIADGKPLVVNFWATWCPYCIEEMPDFQAIYDDYGDRVAFAFVDATDNARETVDDGKAWIADTGYTMPFYFDVARQAVSAFGIQAYPTTVVVSASGEIMTISPGKIDPDLMRSALDSLL